MTGPGPVHDVGGGEAALRRQGDEYDAAAGAKGAAPVAPVLFAVGDVFDGLGDAQVRGVLGELEVADELDAGRLVLFAGQARRAWPGDLAFPLPKPEVGVSGDDHFGADVEAAAGGAERWVAALKGCAFLLGVEVDGVGAFARVFENAAGR